MSVRAKFKVDSIERSKYGNDELQAVKLSPVISGSEDNKQFFRWTPSGSIVLGTVNPEAAKQFELGKEYFIDFTPADQ